MDYEKLYNEALERAKYCLTTDMDNSGHWAVKHIFPELKESEDERIRKALIRLFTSNNIEQYGDVTNKQIITWLEKQSVQNPTDKVEPKFKVGDWVIDKQNIVHQIANVIENVTSNTYGYDIVGGGYFNDNAEGVRLWTIQDAKNGDILCCNNGDDKTIYLFKEQRGSTDIANAHFQIVNRNYELRLMVDKAADFNLHTKPATKEQRDLLFNKMKEAGYEWDAEKKELKSIKQK